MSDFLLFSETNTDITAEMAKELDVTLLPMRFIIDEQEYSNNDMPIKEFYTKLRDGKVSSTSQINTVEFIEYFEPLLKEGKDILYIVFSSGLSGTYNAAVTAKDELLAKYPERKFMLVDSLGASMGEGLVLYYAATKRKAGESMESICAWMLENIQKFNYWFTVDDLFYLKRGGRVSTTSAIVGTMLGIKPVLHVDSEGHLVPVSKVRGRKQSLDALVKKYETTAINPKEQVVFISHGDAKADVEYVANAIKKIGCKKVITNYIGPVIGSHSGPGTIALFFLGTGR
ncbi:MAG: DegV family protein [Clostridia bacterium]